MKLRFAPRAKADIAEIHAYIADRNPQAAKAVVRRIKTTAELLAQYPGVGRITDIASVRVLAAAPFPYLLYYTHTSSTVVITHVRHGAREAPLPDDL